MQLKLWNRVQYRVQFDRCWIRYAAFFTGVAFFLISLVQFGFQNICELPSKDLVLTVILPLVTLAAFMVLIQGIRLQTAPAYGIVGAVYCVFLVIQAISYNGSANKILAVCWYIIAAAVLLITGFGLIPTRLFAVLVFLGPAVYRFVRVDIDRYFAVKDYKGFLPEAAILCGLLAFATFAMAMKPTKTEKTEQ